MDVKKNINLSQLNTFGIECVAREFVEITDASTLKPVLNPEDVFVLGGGSNLLLPSFLDKQVWWIRNNFIRTRYEENSVYVEAAAGIVWHDLVTLAVRMGWGGIENMALIPGQVGAAPVQNIGAYGVELKDVFHSLEAFELTTGKRRTFYLEDCQFNYRQSVFKNKFKGRFVITSVTLKLSTGAHAIKSSYWALEQALQQSGVTQPTIADIYDAVVAVRKSKLPDPNEIGNSGSFFKNPIISNEQFQKLIQQYPTMKYYETAEGDYKIPAGYLIEECGWKGKRVGNTGCFEKQALVIVNYGGASSEEVQAHVQAVKSSVFSRYGIMLEEEVNIIQK